MKSHFQDLKDQYRSNRQFLWRVIRVFLAWIILFSGFTGKVNANGTIPQDNKTAVQVIDIHPGEEGSQPGLFTNIGDTLFFRADDGQNGMELWKSTAPYDAIHTNLVSDIYPGEEGSWPENLTPLGETLFFQADDGKVGRELWILEPPYLKARLAADINAGPDGSTPQFFKILGNSLFFQADGGSGAELWKCSPPYFSASQVVDLWPGSTGSSPRDLTTIGWTLLFSADDSTGRELWKSEPPYDAKSTRMVKKIFPGGASRPEDLLPVGLDLFFTATNQEDGKELWKSEAPFDEEHTIRTNDIDHLFPSNPSDLKAIGGTVFYTANVGFSGFELRKIVPPYTSTAMSRVEDIYEGYTLGVPNSSFPKKKTTLGQVLFFTAFNAESGEELWKAIPPYTTADMVEDINPDQSSSTPQNITPLGTTLFFTANDGSFGREIWRSTPPYDEPRTQMVVDLAKGARGSDPKYLFALGRTLFFSADDGKTGAELWKIDLEGGLFLPETGFAPGLKSSISSQPAWVNYETVDDLRLDIPILDIDIPLVGGPVSDKGWDLTWLGKQAAYLVGTAFPTLPGNTGIAAHAYLADGTPGPFARLDQLKWGDRIELKAWGQRHIYEVRDVRRVAADDTSVLRHEDLSWLTLITCKEYDEELGGYRWRSVVRAVLIAVIP